MWSTCSGSFMVVVELLSLRYQFQLHRCRWRVLAAADAVDKALMYAYRDRKAKKRNFRRIWITRINAAARMNNISYSKLVHGLKLANVEIDRKVLADLAISDPPAFTKIANMALEQA